MAIINCLFSPTSENPRGFSAWCILAKFRANPRNYSQPRPQSITNENIHNSYSRINNCKSIRFYYVFRTSRTTVHFDILDSIDSINIDFISYVFDKKIKIPYNIDNSYFDYYNYDWIAIMVTRFPCIRTSNERSRTIVLRYWNTITDNTFDNFN